MQMYYRILFPFFYYLIALTPKMIERDRLRELQEKFRSNSQKGSVEPTQQLGIAEDNLENPSNNSKDNTAVPNNTSSHNILPKKDSLTVTRITRTKPVGKVAPFAKSQNEPSIMVSKVNTPNPSKGLRVRPFAVDPAKKQNFSSQTECNKSLDIPTNNVTVTISPAASTWHHIATNPVATNGNLVLIKKRSQQSSTPPNSNGDGRTIMPRPLILKTQR